MNKIIATALLTTLAATANAGELMENNGLHLGVTYGSSTLSVGNTGGDKELSGLKISSGFVKQDAEGRVYFNGDIGFKMNSINTPQTIPFKLYSMVFDAGLGLAQVDRMMHENEAQWPRWVDNLSFAVGFGLPMIASEKVLPGLGSKTMTYTTRYGVRYYITPKFNVALTTEKLNGLIVRNTVASATTKGVEIEYAF
jgi:hypothetical protein